MKNGRAPLVRDKLRLDPALESARIESSIRDIVFGQLRRKGVVVGVSGGIDSSVVAYLCARALGAERIQLLFMPEIESSSDSLKLGRLVADALGVRAAAEDIGPALQAAGCYERRDAAVRLVAPEYGPGWKLKIVLPGLMDASPYSVFSAVLRSPGGAETTVRLSAAAYLGIVAATNFKQRVRKMMEYYYADLLNFAVAGTPNRLEHDLGFFVKNGDGSADLKPIAHLYKTQVYQMAEYLGVPEEIRQRKPTTDTYPLEQSQEEFYFMMPLEQLDCCLYARDNGIEASVLAGELGLEVSAVERMYGIIDSKRKAAKYLHAAPLGIEGVTGLGN